MTTSKIVAEVVWLALMLSAGFVGAIRTLPLWVLGDSTELWIASGVSFLLIDRAVVSGEKLAKRLIDMSAERRSDEAIHGLGEAIKGMSPAQHDTYIKTGRLP